MSQITARIFIFWYSSGTIHEGPWEVAIDASKCILPWQLQWSHFFFPPSEVRIIVRVLMKYDSWKKESIKAIELKNVVNVWVTRKRVFQQMGWNQNGLRKHRMNYVNGQKDSQYSYSNRPKFFKVCQRLPSDAADPGRSTLSESLSAVSQNGGTVKSLAVLSVFDKK